MTNGSLNEMTKKNLLKFFNEYANYHKILFCFKFVCMCTLRLLHVEIHKTKDLIANSFETANLNNHYTQYWSEVSIVLVNYISCLCEYYIFSLQYKNGNINICH